jgi:hypothetical protein
MDAFLGALALGDIADRRQHEALAVRTGDRTQCDLDRELLPIRALSDQRLVRRAHRPHPGVVHVGGAMRMVAGAQCGRQQDFNGLANHCAGLIAE